MPRSTLSSLKSRLRRPVSALVYTLLVLVLLAWVGMAIAWGVLHHVVIPQIDSYRPRLEQISSKGLGLPVRIAQLKAHSHGLIPAFELLDVALFDARGQEALRLPRVVAAVSPWSLLRLRFDQLYIDQPQLDIRRTPDGKIYIAGLEITQRPNDNHQVADWFFSQTEFVIRGGTVRWVDDQLGLPTLTLTQVDWVMRNAGRRHSMRLDATPPPAWGQRFSLHGIFKQPWFSSQSTGQWRSWNGRLYAQTNELNVEQARPYLDIDTTGTDVLSGSGALRAWVNVHAGQPREAHLDVALQNVDVQLQRTLQPLSLPTASGRFGGKWLDHGFEFYTQDLRFETSDGARWPGGNISISHTRAQGNTTAINEVKANKLDLGALAMIAKRLPLQAGTHAQLASLAPHGLVDTLHAQWQGEWTAPTTFAAQGRITQLHLASQAAAPPAVPPVQASAYAIYPGRPGVRGVDIDFDLTQAGGKAHVNLKNGHLEFPGVFEEPRIALHQLAGDLQWKRSGPSLQVQLRNLSFANAHTQGQVQASWHTDDAAKPNPARPGQDLRFPGILDLQGSFSRADAAHVHRYLPLLLDPGTRHYVRDAVLAGTSSDVKFKLKGNLWDMPFTSPQVGQFKLTASVRDAMLAYIPPSIQAPDEPPWAKLHDLSGDLVMEQAALTLKNASARVGAGTDLKLSQGYAHIADMHRAIAHLEVAAQVKGAANKALGFIQHSPLNALTHQAFAKTVASGPMELDLKLGIPLATPEKTQVHAKLTLAGNELWLDPAAPKMTGLKAQVEVNPTGFAIPTAQAHMLGGDVRFEGGTTPEGNVLIQAKGSVSAEGLRQAKNLGFIASLGQNVSGSTTYTAKLGFKQGLSELGITSNLQGLALNLPPPLNKNASTSLPLRLETTLLPHPLETKQKPQDQMSLHLGKVLALNYVRDLSGPEARVVRGSIGVGVEGNASVPLEDGTVAAHVNLGKVDLDVWGKLLSGPANTPSPRLQAGSSALTYLPTRMAIRAQELVIDGHTLNNVVVGGSRDGLTWKANIDAAQLNGYLELRQPASARGSGRVFARLARLTLAANSANEVEAILDEPPSSIPALDIVVDDFELHGKKLGRLEIDAVNRSPAAAAREGLTREWRLNKLNVVMPEATFSASGNWASLGAQSDTTGVPRAQRPRADKRRTVMNFKLDINNAGDLLKRFGMNDLIRRGKGKIEGQVAWIGSPLALDYPTLGGQFNVNVETGQFLKAEPGIAKLLGVLSLQALPRRLILDFRDVFSEGFSFDFVRGDVTIAQGLAATNNLKMKGVNAAVLMEGTANIAKETQDLKVVVIPEINAGTASVLASILNPAVGIGSFLAQVILRRPLIAATTQEFHITGPWADPTVSKVNRKPEDKPAEAASSVEP